MGLRCCVAVFPPSAREEPVAKTVPVKTAAWPCIIRRTHTPRLAQFSLSLASSRVILSLFPVPQSAQTRLDAPLTPDGEGSAREHAALQPRFYGCNLIVARSFARIHETNLKKQGVLPLWLVDKSAYSNISAHDKVQTVGMADILSGASTSDRVMLKVTSPDGEVREVECRHTLSTDQVEWLRTGSALNWIGEVARQRGASA